MKKRVPPLTPQQTKHYLLHPEDFHINRLEANEMLQQDGSSIVKIPQIGDRIRQDGAGKISLVVSRETDETTGEIKEETVIIGSDISSILPGMMFASDVYHDYFDYFGELINDPMKGNTSSVRQSLTASPQGEAKGTSSGRSDPPQGEGNESPGACHQVTHVTDWEEKVFAAGIEHTPMFNREIRNAHRGLKGEKLKKLIEEELKTKHYVQIGEYEFVRFPDVAKERIRVLPQNEKGLCPVELIHGRWYDAKRKQMRNRKTRIGYIIDELPGIMIPNRRYSSCFEESSGKAYEDSIAEKIEEIRKDHEIRTQREEEARLRKEEEESYRALFGENNEHESDVARMRLEKIVSEMQEQRAEANEDNEEDYEEVEEAENEPADSLNPIQALPAPAARMTHQEEETEMSHRPSHFAGVSMEDERAAILVKILEAITEAIKTQAKKHPDALINIYKARKINEILIEIKLRYQDSGYGDLLELIEEPHEVEEDGQRYLTGMTYSDVEVLLCHYGTILEHIHLKSKK